MKTLYLDIFSGISGDMFIGALIDLGVDPRKLERELGKLNLDGYHLHVSRQQKSAIEGMKFDVHLAGAHDHHHEHGHPHGHDHGHHAEHHHHDDSRNLTKIKALISRSKLSPWVKQKSLAVFQRIAEAEGKIHGVPPETVHFHEVGAVDSIVDIVGASIGLELLGKPRVISSAVTEGVGWINCTHGRFPIPAPATLAILGARGIGITQCDEPHELITPTGAALLAEFAESFGPMDGLVAERIGFGLGTRDNKTRPNVLRAVLGSAKAGKVKSQSGPTPLASRLSPAPDWETDTVAVLETNLDDINAEILGQFVETALAKGALDVFHTPIQMKKNRPGVMLTVLCAEADADKFGEMILRETSAFGVRRHLAERRKLRREFTEVKTKFGNVTVKLGRLNGEMIQAAPEFESCRKTAAKAKVPVKQVYEAAIRASKAK
ncbi:MAG TPA: nickel pincer cofactor biosynthesis protein LarC [Candidatus Paceibacterota bacterium]|nr:nickel pincer cofactor biosynthesis protein LarC [Candidatus Paceibacterota bacterium]